MNPRDSAMPLSRKLWEHKIQAHSYYLFQKPVTSPTGRHVTAYTRHKFSKKLIIMCSKKEFIFFRRIL